jgi:hypothetical protein
VTRRFTSVLIVGTALFSSFTAAPEGAQQGITRVGWLQGCWIMTAGQSTIEEHWMAPRGGTMIGTGRTVRNGRLADYELIVLREQGDRLAYEAHPSGQPATTFLSRTIDEAMVVFENAEHDFPQRVGYERSSTDSLKAWIEGSDKGQPRRVEFAYRRAPCGGAS